MRDIEKKMNMQVLAKTTLPLMAAASLLLAACAVTPPTEQSATSAEAEKTYEFEPWDGDGMNIPIDGSSMEAFNASCARIKAYTTPEEYAAFQRALEWHLTYDLAARDKLELLVPRLDGKTPADLLKSVRWRKHDKNTSPVEKDAADAKFIDT
jgi:hypothetical protein